MSIICTFVFFFSLKAVSVRLSQDKDREQISDEPKDYVYCCTAVLLSAVLHLFRFPRLRFVRN